MADNTDTTRPGETEAVEPARLGLEIATAMIRGGMSLESAERQIVAFAAAVREQAEAAAYEQGRRDAHGTIPARIAAAERAVREQVAHDIEAHAGPYIKGRQDIRVGVQTWPEEAARGYTQAIDEVLDLVRGGR